ncbi:MAG: pilin [Patescibacteria group bacterium]
MPMFYALETNALTAEEILSLGKPFKDGLKPCVEELVKNGEEPAGTPKYKDGPDAGYLIMVIEEPLNIEPTKLPDGDYVVRRCFRNTFQYTIPGGQSATLPFFAKECSDTAKTLANTYKYKDKNDPSAQAKFSCREVQVILTKGGTIAIYGYIGMIYRWGASIVGIIAVTVIILSGIQISAAGGDAEAVGSAKKRILQSIAGIIVLFLSGLILYTINPTFFTQTPTP